MTLIAEALSVFEHEGMMVLSVFIDLKKAFDTVSHPIILDKLKALGVTDTELSWFKSYLSGRRQFVYVNGKNSDQLTVFCWHPPGFADGSTFISANHK